MGFCIIGPPQGHGCFRVWRFSWQSLNNFFGRVLKSKSLIPLIRFVEAPTGVSRRGGDWYTQMDSKEDVADSSDYQFPPRDDPYWQFSGHVKGGGIARAQREDDNLGGDEEGHLDEELFEVLLEDCDGVDETSED